MCCFCYDAIDMTEESLTYLAFLQYQLLYAQSTYQVLCAGLVQVV